MSKPRPNRMSDKKLAVELVEIDAQLKALVARRGLITGEQNRRFDGGKRRTGNDKKAAQSTTGAAS